LQRDMIISCISSPPTRINYLLSTVASHYFFSRIWSHHHRLTVIYYACSNVS